VRVNQDGFFRLFKVYSRISNEPEKFATRLVLTMWFDMKKPTSSFFGILMGSKLVTGLRPEHREVYDMWYIVDETRYEEAPTLPALPQVLSPPTKDE
jgi:hypothetical protein